jgi:hypothetical protein
MPTRDQLTPEGLAAIRRTSRRNGRRLVQEKRGIHTPGYSQSPEMQEIRRRNAEQLAQDQKGIFAPGFYDRPEIKKAHHENGIVQGNAAVERGDGIHAPGVASLGGKRSVESGKGLFSKDADYTEAHRRGGENQSLLHVKYGMHIQWHIDRGHRIKGKPCVFCDNPKSLPKWFFEKLKAEFRGGPL